MLLPRFHGKAIAHHTQLIEQITAEEVDRWPIGEEFALWPRMRVITMEVTTGADVQNVGEPRAPAPRQAGAQAPIDTRRTPRQAILQFAGRYANWTYETLATHQLSLASISVGAARLAEQQAAAATRADATLARARIANSGEVLSVSPDLARDGWWVVVTRERTVGNGEYEGLAPGLHVTLVQLAFVGNRWAASQWLPQG